MTAEEQEADAKGCYDLAIKVIGDGVKETGIIPECLLGDGEHSRRLRAEQENRALRNLVSDALAIWVPCTLETALWRVRARRELAKGTIRLT
jgi:hypothetical protein